MKRGMTGSKEISFLPHPLKTGRGGWKPFQSQFHPCPRIRKRQKEEELNLFTVQGTLPSQPITMKGFLVLFCLVGISLAAPQNWPRREGAITPHLRYVHPPKTNYRYLPQLEDDEEIGMGRQEPLVGTVPNPSVVSVTAQPTVAPVAPAEPPKEAPAIPAAPPALPPVAPPGNVGTGPQRPPLPRPTPPPKEEEEEEEDEEDDDDDETEEADDDEDNDDEDEDEDDEEERKRQEVTSDKKVVPPPPVQKPVLGKPIAPAPVIVPVKPSEPSSGSVEEVSAVPSVESNEVEAPVGESSEQLEDGMEALVPGYITDQGEVLVPVDTVTGDQHISIVPDPYTRQRHGSTFDNYRSHPFYYQDAGQDYFGF